MPHRIFITAAETSGDHHAAALIASIKSLEPDVIIEAHGGPAMRAAGALVHHETTKRAAFALRAIGRAFEVMRLLKWTRKHFAENRPDLLICVDSFAMNYHFAKLARRMGIPVLYYIAPQLWASRPWRIKKLRAVVNRVASILPFEEQYLRDRGVDATFVGHPLFDQLPQTRSAPPDMNGRPPVIGLLTGSRKAEAVQNFPRLLEVAAQIRETFPGAEFLVPTTHATHPIVHELAKDVAYVSVGENQIDAMLPRCDFALVKSGTATLHVAAFGVPMIIVYYGSPLMWHGIGRWVITTRTFGLVNLLASTSEHIVPEVIPWNGPTKPLADMAIEFLKTESMRKAQREKIVELIDQLGKTGASENVARMAIKMISDQVPASAGVP